MFHCPESFCKQKDMGDINFTERCHTTITWEGTEALTKKIKLLSIKVFRQTFAMLWHIIAKHLTVNELKLSMPGIFKYIYRLLTEPNADIQKDKEWAT